MNHRLCDPLEWQDDRVYDRGKVMTAEELEAGKDFGRYLDVDGDGIPFRTLPGTHPSRGAYFTRGTTKDEYARYSEEGDVYIQNMERLQRKFETAKSIVPQPIRRDAPEETRIGALYFGSTSPAMDEALDDLEAMGLYVNAMRLRAFPFPDSVREFIMAHDKVFIVEQNRDGQMRSIITNELGIDPARLTAVLHYDGTPITGRFISEAFQDHMEQFKIVPFESAAS
jgi:2-oxoglutarate ferredoxin oxidoreductase subunit alpha